MALYNQGNKVGIGTVDLSEVNKSLDDKQNKNSALKHLYNSAIASAHTNTSSPNYYIRVDGIPTDYTGSTHVKSWKIRTRYSHSYELVITPWNNEGTNADKVLRLLAIEGTASTSSTVDCAYKFVTENDNITMSIIFKVYCRASATPFRVANMISEVGDIDNYTWTKLGNDNEIVTLEDGSTMSCADYYTTFTPCQKTELATMDKLNYSTDEVKIGTYMGEPLYRKCIIVEGTSSQGKIDFNNIKGLEPNYNVISLTGTLDALSDGLYTFPVPYSLIDTDESGNLAWYRIYTYYDKGTGNILFNAKSSVSAYYKGKFKIKLIVEYTK